MSRISNLPPEIGRLTKLKRLIAPNIGLQGLPKELLSLKELNFLDLRQNELPIPPEILTKQYEPQAILDYYFHQRKTPLNEVKIITVGQGGVGKTSLIRRLLENTYSPQENKTDGIAIHKFSFRTQGQTYAINVWDFGGQEIMHATHQFFLTKRSLYLLVFDTRLTQEENRIEYWLKIIQSFGGESPVFVVAAKIDQHLLDIDCVGLRKKYPNIVGILETSAATGAGIDTLGNAIIEEVLNLPHVRDLVPESWIMIKAKLEELGHELNFITNDRYLELCVANNTGDETSQRMLIGFLHDLGVVLYFQDDPRLELLGILNPQWVTNGVYKILNSHALFQNKGVLHRAMLDEVLNFPEYPASKRLFIVDMMRKFELCYDIEPDKIFLVPDLLPKDEPNTGDWSGKLAFQYHYNVLPSSILTRFIVRMNAFIHGIVWRSGVVLRSGGNTALVKADTEDRKVYIWVSGDDHKRRDFLAKIRGEFDAIHKTIIKIEAHEKVPVPGHPEAEPVDYDLLMQMEHNGVDVYPVLSSGKMILVNVREMLSGVAREADRQLGNVTNIYVGGDMVGRDKVNRSLQVGDINNSRGVAIGDETQATAEEHSDDE